MLINPLESKFIAKWYFNRLMRKNSSKMKKLKRELKQLNRDNRAIFEFLINHDLYDYDSN